MAHKLLGDVRKNDQFWLVDGTNLKNIHDLVKSLPKMDDETFDHHVNEERNDFHAWVREVHGDDKLADNLLEVTTQKDAMNVIKERIKEVQEPVRKKANKKTQKKAQAKKKAGKAKSKPAKRKARNVTMLDPEKFKQHKKRKHHILAIIAAVILLVAIIGLASFAANITGAMVASSVTGNIKFAGLGGIIGVFILLFVTLHVIHEKHK